MPFEPSSVSDLGAPPRRVPHNGLIEHDRREVHRLREAVRKHKGHGKKEHELRKALEHAEERLRKHVAEAQQARVAGEVRGAVARLGGEELGAAPAQVRRVDALRIRAARAAVLRLKAAVKKNARKPTVVRRLLVRLREAEASLKHAIAMAQSHAGKLKGPIPSKAALLAATPVQTAEQAAADAPAEGADDGADKVDAAADKVDAAADKGAEDRPPIWKNPWVWGGLALVGGGVLYTRSSGRTRA